MKAKEQILTASILGTQAFNNGKRCVPAMDQELMNIIGSRKIGVTPKGEATSKKIMNTWIESWTKANLAARNK